MRRLAALALCLMLTVTAFAETEPLVSALAAAAEGHGLPAISERLTELDPETGAAWAPVFAFWAAMESEGPTWTDALDGTREDLCIVIPGYRLEPDGSMNDELKRRLDAALLLRSTMPDCPVLVTGGATATENASATEAGVMRDYLIARGVPEDRVIVEDRALSTLENALNGMELLRERTDIAGLVIVTSASHVTRAATAFEAVRLLKDPTLPPVVATVGCATELTENDRVLTTALLARLGGDDLYEQVLEALSEQAA